MQLPEFEGKLSNLDDEAVEECVLAALDSFGHQFTQEELSQLETLGDFYNLVEKKFANRHSPECTSQHAFYKLRVAIAEVLKMEKSCITPSTPVEELFPRRTRRRKMKQVQQRLGIKTKLLEMKGWLRTVFAVSMVASFIILFFSWKVGLIALVALILTNRIAAIFNNELRYTTLRDLSEYLMIFEYGVVRKDPETVNPHELRQVINQVFIRREALKREHLTATSRMIQ